MLSRPVAVDSVERAQFERIVNWLVERLVDERWSKIRAVRKKTLRRELAGPPVKRGHERAPRGAVRASLVAEEKELRAAIRRAIWEEVRQVVRAAGAALEKPARG